MVEIGGSGLVTLDDYLKGVKLRVNINIDSLNISSD